MNIFDFFAALKRQKPLIAVRGDIFNTPADHIAFAVHWPNDAGHSDNDDGGFSSLVASYGWPELSSIKFEKGKPQSKTIKGKTFHALPVHTPQENGWDEAPELIEQCLNMLPVPSNEVIACVLIGGGHAGQKYKASVRNLEGMIHTHKTVVLYVYDEAMFNLLLATGVVAQSIPFGIPLNKLPKPILYKDKESYEKLLQEAGVQEFELA